MSIEIKVPSLGESISEATIGQILQPSGNIVAQDAEILELETDKVNQVLYAPAAGKITLHVQTGEVVKVDQVIGIIEPSSQKESIKAVPKPEAKPTPKPEAKKTAAPLPIKEVPAQEGVTRKKMTKLRKVIAQRLVEVKNQTAMLTTFNEVDMSAVMAVRQKEQESFQARHNVKLGFMSFFVKACVAALEEYPEVNARIDGDEIVYFSSCNIGVAVGTEKGLFVPVLRNAGSMGYADIEKKLKEYAEKARNGTISIDELQGGTFTISNGGTYGSLLSTPILNPPESGILGMHNIVKRPVVVDDQIVIRPMMYLALSYDHRIVDGKEAIGFLVHIKKNLEEPTRLLLDL